VSRHSNFASLRSDRHLEAVGNSTGHRDERVGYLRRIEFACSVRKNQEPSIEMLSFKGHHEVRTHRAPIVAARPEHHGRPEVCDFSDMVLPVLHGAVKNRPDELVLTRSSVEGSDEQCDRLVINFEMIDALRVVDQLSAGGCHLNSRFVRKRLIHNASADHPSREYLAPEPN
jgi:hypothetical protein